MLKFFRSLGLAENKVEDMKANDLSGLEDLDLENDLRALEIPEDTKGLHVVHSPACDEEALFDLIFVHGLGGDSFSTWTARESKVFWPKEFLAQSALFMRSRIMVFGYDSRAFVKPFAEKTKGRVFTFGEELIAALADARIETHEQRRPLVLAGHSLGGIVIKSAMVYGRAKPTLYKDLIDSIVALFFFGTPHQGADIASWGTFLGHIGKAVGVKTTQVTAELQRWSKPLLELNTMFSEQIPDLFVTTFWEKQPTYGITVVHEGAARLTNLKKEVVVGMDANHLTICKFSSNESAAFRIVRSRFEAVARAIERDRQNVSESTSEQALAQRLSSLKNVPAENEDNVTSDASTEGR